MLAALHFQPGFDPVQPGAHAVAGGGRDAEDGQVGIDAAGIGFGQVGVEAEVGQQVALVEQHDVGRGEHVGILERLVLALGDRQDGDLVVFAEVEGGRADEVADVLDQEQRFVLGLQALHGVADHVAVEVAALAGVDLQRRHAGGADALGVVGGLLVAFDDVDGDLVLQQLDGLAEQGRLARAGAGDEVEGEDAALVEPGAVGVGVGVVLGQDVLLDLHHARLRHAGDVCAGRAGAVIEVAADGVFVVVVMLVIMAVFVPVIVVVRMAVGAAVGMHMLVRMPMNVRMLALMHMIMDMRRAVSMGMAVGMGGGQCGAVMAMGVIVLMPVAVRMHRAVFMDVGMFMRPALDLHLTCAAAANRTHPRLLYSISISLTRMSVPPVACTWWLPQVGQAP